MTSDSSEQDLNALFAQAVGAHRAGRMSEATAAYEQVLALRPDIAEVHSNLGLLLWHQEHFDEAIQHFEQMLQLKVELADAHAHLASTLRERRGFESLVARFDRALAAAYLKLGTMLRRQGQFEPAAARLQHALALDPQLPEAHYNLGLIAWHVGQLDQAAWFYQRAIALRPDYIEALNNLASTLREQCRVAEARQVFERLLALAPDSATAEMGLGICSLLEGDYQQGWRAYEARLRLPGLPPPPDIPRWTGQSLQGRSLLLLVEQGLGDTIHFVRYARTFKSLGARVVLAAQDVLSRLLESHPDLDELVPLGRDRPYPRCDFYLPLLSAPLELHTSAATIPGRVPYLAADAQLTEQWREELRQVPGFRVGIAWQGSREYTSDRWRSMPLACFAPLARLPGVRLVSLQKGFGAEQVAAVDFAVLDLSHRLDEAAGPFLDTAAVIRNLDLVIAPDTVVAHLAGALAVPVFLALQFSPDWRWLLDRDDSPWYPTMRLFRQTVLGQWTDVFERMALVLAERL